MEFQTDTSHLTGIQKTNMSLESWINTTPLPTTPVEPDKSFGMARGQNYGIGNEDFVSVAKNLGVNPDVTRNVINRVNDFLIAGNYASVGTEGFSAKPKDGLFHRVGTMSLENISRSGVYDLVVNCLGDQAPARAIETTVNEIGAILSNENLLGETYEANSKTVPSNGIQLYDVCGARAYGEIMSTSVGNESFGNSVNTLDINTRLAVTVSILRNFSSTIDKLFLRKTDGSNLIVLEIPNPTVFDLERMSSRKADVRNSPLTEIPLVNIHADPGIVNTTPKPVMENIQKINDTDNRVDDVSLGVPALVADGQEANLIELTFDENRHGFENVNHTDLIADGGYLRTLAVKITNKTSGTSETYAVPLNNRNGARYIPGNNVSDSGDTFLNVRDVPFLVTSASVPQGNSGEITKLFSTLGRACINFQVSFRSDLQLKSGNISGSGSLKPVVIPSGGSSAQLARPDMEAASTLLKDLEFNIVAYEPMLTFAEDNVRKSTVSTRVNWLQRTFQIPQGQNFMTDIAITQVPEEAAMQTMQTAMSIGNSDRGMAVIESVMEETADILMSAKANPEIYRRNRAQDISLAGTLCRPYVLRGSLDLQKLSVATMRESERLTDRTAKVKQILLNTLSNIVSRSLYTTNLLPGERMSFKLLGGAPMADIIFSIPSYHKELEDATAKANGADYSFVLDNGIRIDVIKTNFSTWRDKMALFPIRESNAADITSFATIRDRGVLAATVNGGVYDGATLTRHIVNSREYVLATNPIGVILSMKNVAIDMPGIEIIDAY